jgi:integrating conjugative element membrane protein (TIGR03745 family)
MRFVQLFGLMIPSMSYAIGLPAVTPPGGNGAADEPTSLISDTFSWGINVVVLGLVALLFITVVKNAQSKYHHMGEEGSKVTWRDLTVNMIVGVALVVIAIAYGMYALNIF